ncbi:sensor histidine kinase [Anseongella ginsenosidimutans]|nr:sensor histidine kinase [Anseongella ginsenosidimutans]
MLKKIYHYLAGDSLSYSFEHRVFNLTSFIIMVFGMQAAILNYLIGLHIVTVWLAISGSVVSASLFYLSRVRKWFTATTIFVFITATIFVLGGSYFYNGGSSSPVLYFLFVLLNIFLLIASRKHQLLIYGLLAGAILALLLLEYYFPEMVVPYSSFEERMTDHITLLIYCPLFTMVVIVLFRRSYDWEQEMVLRQKQKLEEVNRITTEKNEYIESLIRELHHRVKNNLQIVSGLLSLQSNRLQDNNARMALEEGKTRVDAIAMIHQKLYMDNALATVNIEEYLSNLSSSLANSFGYDAACIHTDIRLNNHSMGIDMAIPIGLIVNELVTNSFKHAFQETTEPRIVVSLQERQEKLLELTVADNGKGLGDPEKLKDSDSFGMKLLRILVEQINGAMTIRQDAGTAFTIEIRA